MARQCPEPLVRRDYPLGRASMLALHLGMSETSSTRCFPAHAPAPLVTVHDGHPHTLAFLAGARGDRIRCLGVSEFGQSSDLADAYVLHEIDRTAITDAALGLIGR
jgi:pyruvate dehydrogenase complex dehydrogenase (E1) component